MPQQRGMDKVRASEIDDMLEYLRQLKEDAVDMIVSLQSGRDGTMPKSGRAQKRSKI